MAPSFDLTDAATAVIDRDERLAPDETRRATSGPHHQLYKEIRPQSGGQVAFLRCSADICVFGGKAGAGKTSGLLFEPTRHHRNAGFGAVAFRREGKQLTIEGGLWDESCKIYPLLGARPRSSSQFLDWTFPSGACVSMASMEQEIDRLKFDGLQAALLLFDQLEQFTGTQFFYMLSRNRSTCGVDPYIRGTCNPDPDCFLREFMSWWIDDMSGLAIPDRSGVQRWFVRDDSGEVVWADTKAELIEITGCDPEDPLSFTFIIGDVYENKELLKKDPRYIAKLKALPPIDRARKLDGNWNARATAGTYFRRGMFEIVKAAPGPREWDEAIRYWDRAVTPPGPKSERASFTCGLKLVKKDGTYYIADVQRFQGNPGQVRKEILGVARHDGLACQVGIEQDPGGAGITEAQDLAAMLDGYDVVINTVHESKGLRATPVSAQASAGNVKIVSAHWNEPFIREAENFDGTQGPNRKTDQIDALSGAHSVLSGKVYARVLR